jgi:hypothetical protein
MMGRGMMMTIVETLWPRLHTALAEFAEKLATIDPALIHNCGRTANDAFLLRGYSAFRRHADGDEVAITVDLRSDHQQLMIESDICTDDGRVVAVGPSAAIPLSEENPNVETTLSDWLCEFEQFLLENESAVAAAVSRLA